MTRVLPSRWIAALAAAPLLLAGCTSGDTPTAPSARATGRSTTATTSASATDENAAAEVTVAAAAPKLITPADIAGTEAYQVSPYGAFFRLPSRPGCNEAAYLFPRYDEKKLNNLSPDAVPVATAKAAVWNKSLQRSTIEAVFAVDPTKTLQAFRRHLDTCKDPTLKVEPSPLSPGALRIYSVTEPNKGIVVAAVVYLIPLRDGLVTLFVNNTPKGSFTEAEEIARLAVRKAGITAS